MIKITSKRLGLLVSGKALLVFQSGRLDSVSLIKDGFENEKPLRQKGIKFFMKIIDMLNTCEVYVGELTRAEVSGGQIVGRLFCYQNENDKYVPIEKSEVIDVKRMGYEVFRVN